MEVSGISTLAVEIAMVMGERVGLSIVIFDVYGDLIAMEKSSEITSP
jgi:hypothetical protein